IRPMSAYFSCVRRVGLHLEQRHVISACVQIPETLRAKVRLHAVTATFGWTAGKAYLRGPTVLYAIDFPESGSRSPVQYLGMTAATIFVLRNLAVSLCWTNER